MIFSLFLETQTGFGYTHVDMHGYLIILTSTEWNHCRGRTLRASMCTCQIKRRKKYCLGPSARALYWFVTHKGDDGRYELSTAGVESVLIFFTWCFKLRRLSKCENFRSSNNIFVSFFQLKEEWSWAVEFHESGRLLIVSGVHLCWMLHCERYSATWILTYIETNPLVGSKRNKLQKSQHGEFSFRQ